MAVLSALLFLTFLSEWLPAALLPDWSGGPGWPEYFLGAAGVLLFNYAMHLRDRYGPPLARERRPIRLRLWASGPQAEKIGPPTAILMTQGEGVRIEISLS